MAQTSLTKPSMNDAHELGPVQQQLLRQSGRYSI